jgi:hypothetical protein
MGVATATPAGCSAVAAGARPQAAATGPTPVPAVVVPEAPVPWVRHVLLCSDLPHAPVVWRPDLLLTPVYGVLPSAAPLVCRTDILRSPVMVICFILHVMC